jgi:hypothetical protein
VSGSVSAGSLSGEGRMARGPSPGTVSGHQGEARRNLVWGSGNHGPRPEKRGSSEDHLAISWADLCFIRGPAGGTHFFSPLRAQKNLRYSFSKP